MAIKALTHPHTHTPCICAPAAWLCTHARTHAQHPIYSPGSWRAYIVTRRQVRLDLELLSIFVAFVFSLPTCTAYACMRTRCTRPRLHTIPIPAPRLVASLLCSGRP